jgi:hypothetical protein
MNNCLREYFVHVKLDSTQKIYKVIIMTIKIGA